MSPPATVKEIRRSLCSGSCRGESFGLATMDRPISRARPGSGDWCFAARQRICRRASELPASHREPVVPLAPGLSLRHLLGAPKHRPPVLVRVVATRLWFTATPPAHGLTWRVFLPLGHPALQGACSGVGRGGSGIRLIYRSAQIRRDRKVLFRGCERHQNTMRDRYFAHPEYDTADPVGFG